MGLGNRNAKSGDQGSNYKIDLKILQGLEAIIGTTSGGATEATLLMVLASLQSQQEFEQNLVMDLGGAGCPNNCPTYLQVRIWNEVTHTFNPPIYYNAAGVLVSPIGPVQIVNPQYVLQSIDLYLQNINTILGANLDIPVSTLSSEATLLLVENDLINVISELTTVNAELANQGVTLTNIEALLALPSALVQFRNTVITNTAVDISGGAPATLWGWNIINPNIAAVYVKIYNEVAGSVIVGVTPIEMTLMIPGGGSVFTEPNVIQLTCNNALSLACVTTLADAGAVAPGLPILVEIRFKF